MFHGPLLKDGNNHSISVIWVTYQQPKFKKCTFGNAISFPSILDDILSHFFFHSKNKTRTLSLTLHQLALKFIASHCNLQIFYSFCTSESMVWFRFTGPLYCHTSLMQHILSQTLPSNLCMDITDTFLCSCAFKLCNTALWYPPHAFQHVVRIFEELHLLCNWRANLGWWEKSEACFESTQNYFRLKGGLKKSTQIPAQLLSHSEDLRFP